VFTGAGSENRLGWTVGTGIEWAIWNNWSVKAEYDYLDFGTRAVAVSGTVLPSVLPLGASFGMQDMSHVNQFKAGLNWHVPSGFFVFF
jgi:outer membrane immunogenic protein